MKGPSLPSAKLIRTTLTIAVVLFLGFSALAAVYFRAYYDDAMRHMRSEAEEENAAINAKLSPLFIREVSISTSMANDGFLISNRPYKKVFSLEKAFAILREESGRLLDPRIVDAFFAAESEVVKVEEEIREPDPVEGVQQLMPRFYKA